MAIGIRMIRHIFASKIFFSVAKYVTPCCHCLEGGWCNLAAKKPGRSGCAQRWAVAENVWPVYGSMPGPAAASDILYTSFITFDQLLYQPSQSSLIVGCSCLNDMTKKGQKLHCKIVSFAVWKSGTAPHAFSKTATARKKVSERKPQCRPDICHRTAAHHSAPPMTVCLQTALCRNVAMRINRPVSQIFPNFGEERQ